MHILRLKLYQVAGLQAEDRRTYGAQRALSQVDENMDRWQTNCRVIVAQKTTKYNYYKTIIARLQTCKYNQSYAIYFCSIHVRTVSTSPFRCKKYDISKSIWRIQVL